MRWGLLTFIILHGLVHLWYVTLSLKLVEFRPEMGWTGRSWLLSNLARDSVSTSLVSALYILATVAFVVSGAGILLRADWWPPALAGSAFFSALLIFTFWDGGLQMLVQKGLIGFLINLVILAALVRSLAPT